METFNLIVFIWQISLVVSILTFFYGIFKKSWVSLLISFITFIPIAYYFNGVENSWRLVALIPLLLLLLTFVFWKKQKSACI
jgi:ABC-type polysaccharide/polyol phosphate export permease